MKGFSENNHQLKGDQVRDMDDHTSHSSKMKHISHTCIKIFRLFLMQWIQKTAIISSANVTLAKASPHDFHLVMHSQ